MKSSTCFIEGMEVVISFTSHATKRQDRGALSNLYVSSDSIIDTLSLMTSDKEDVVLFRMMEVPCHKVFNSVTGKEEDPKVVVINESQRFAFVASVATSDQIVYLDIITVWPDINILHGAGQFIVHAA